MAAFPDFLIFFTEVEAKLPHGDSNPVSRFALVSGLRV